MFEEIEEGEPERPVLGVLHHAGAEIVHGLRQAHEPRQELHLEQHQIALRHRARRLQPRECLLRGEAAAQLGDVQPALHDRLHAAVAVPAQQRPHHALEVRAVAHALLQPHQSLDRRLRPRVRRLARLEGRTDRA